LNSIDRFRRYPLTYSMRDSIKHPFDKVVSENLYLLKSKCGNYSYYGSLPSPYHIFSSHGKAIEFRDSNKLGSYWLATEVDAESIKNYTSSTF